MLNHAIQGPGDVIKQVPANTEAWAGDVIKQAPANTEAWAGDVIKQAPANTEAWAGDVIKQVPANTEAWAGVSPATGSVAVDILLDCSTDCQQVSNTP